MIKIKDNNTKDGRDDLSHVLDLIFRLGQDYATLVNSEYYSDNKKSDEIKTTYDHIKAEIVTETDSLKDLTQDAVSGLYYIRAIYGDMYGVGFDRIEEKRRVVKQSVLFNID